MVVAFFKFVNIFFRILINAPIKDLIKLTTILVFLKKFLLLCLPTYLTNSVALEPEGS
jgi:hypothetical protein